MSYQNGIAAIHLEMPPKVPRTEYSAHRHWKLVNAVTGLNVSSDSDEKELQKASSEFVKKWDYGMMWSVYLHNFIFGDKKTSMGHAVYEADGSDYDNRIFCPFKSTEEVFSVDFWQTYGRFDRGTLKNDFQRHYQRQCELYDDTVNMTGIYITCISGLIEIFGYEMMLLAAGEDIDRFGDLTNRYCQWMQQFFDALADTDVPVVMVHDDIVWTSGPFLPPAWFRKYVFPNYQKFFEPLLNRNKKILFTSDGNYTEFLDDIVRCGVHGVVMEPTTDMQYFAERYGKTHVFVGNADTRVLLTGTRADIEAEVRRCMDIGKKYPGFIMAVGNHIPANTPVDNALYYNEVYERLAKR